MLSKSFFKSKTFWFNALALCVLVANAFGFVDFEAAPEVPQIGLVLVTTVNLILRFFTDKSVHIRSPPKRS